jgi:hypothetical protein
VEIASGDESDFVKELKVEAEAKGKTNKVEDDDCWVQVVQLGQKGKDLNLRCKKSWTVADLKKQIEKDIAVEANKQKIVFKQIGSKDKGWVATDGQTLSYLLTQAAEPESCRLQLLWDFEVGGTSGVFYGSIF